MKAINVLSIFDGLSGGRIALEKAGIPVDRYFSSEIDKYAIKIADKNYPEDIPHRLGSVLDLTEEQLLGMPKIDLLIGGSPCQGFSVSGKMKGSATACGIDVVTLEQYLKLKSEGFEFDGQSYLFWEYMRVLHILKPKYFFLENVRVTKKWLPMFNAALGVEPIMANSALISAQNRVRFYWTNIPGFKMPEDRGILLKDVIESDLASEKMTTKGKSYCLTARYSGAVAWNSIEKKQRTMIMVEPEEDSQVLCGASRGRYLVDGVRQDGKMLTAGKTAQYLEVRGAGKTTCLTTVQKDNYLTSAQESGRFLLEDCKEVVTKPIKVGEVNKGSQGDRIYSADGKSITLTAQSGGTAGSGNMLLEERPCELRDYKEESLCHHSATALDISGNESIKRVYSATGKSPALTTMQGGHRQPKVLLVPEATKKGFTEVEDGDCFDLAVPNSKTRRGRNMKDKSNCLMTSNQFMRYEHPTYRKLTPLECERLQCLPDGYTEGVSNSQRYKMVGNGWTIDMIVEFFKGIECEPV